MSAISCPVCHEIVSTSAICCMRCGHPMAGGYNNFGVNIGSNANLRKGRLAGRDYNETRNETRNMITKRSGRGKATQHILQGIMALMVAAFVFYGHDSIITAQASQDSGYLAVTSFMEIGGLIYGLLSLIFGIVLLKE